MENKRGLSDVVTTVLIILLVIIAIGTIWQIVRQPIKNTELQSSKADICSKFDVTPLKCELSKTTKNIAGIVTSNEYLVSYERSGEEVADISISKINFIFLKDDFQSKAVSSTDVADLPSQVSATKAKTLILDGANYANELSINLELKGNDEADIVCKESVAVPCVIPPTGVVVNTVNVGAPEITRFEPLQYDSTWTSGTKPLMIFGSGFVDGAQVKFKNSNSDTTTISADFLDSGALAVDIPASVGKVADIYEINVVNMPDGGTSSKKEFAIGLK